MDPQSREILQTSLHGDWGTSLKLGKVTTGVDGFSLSALHQKLKKKKEKKRKKPWKGLLGDGVAF